MKVAEVLRLIQQDGWFLVAQKGSHRQFKHPTKAGRVTVPGKPDDDLALGTRNSILKQAGLKRIGAVPDSRAAPLADEGDQLVVATGGMPMEDPPSPRMVSFVQRLCALQRSQARAPTASPHRSTVTGVPA